MNTSKVILMSVLIFMSLTACNIPIGAQETSTPPPSQPSNTFLPPASTDTPISPSTITAAPTEVIPSATLTPQPPTEIPTNTAIPLGPTDAAEATLAAPFISNCSGFIVSGSISPDTNWAVCQGSESFWLINKNGTQWEFPFIEEYGKTINGGIKAIYWSKDGYVFLIYKHNWDFGGISFYQTATLWRMNLSTGKVTDMVIPALLNENYWGGYAFAFSPLLKRLSYIAEWERPLNIEIVNLRTGEQQKFAMNSKFKSGGAFAWSPDEQKMIVFLVGPMIDDENWSYYSFMYFDYEDTPMTYGIILDEWHSRLSLYKITNDVAVIRSDDKHQWTFNFKTKSIVHEVLP